jgi:hypothetical protein
VRLNRFYFEGGGRFDGRLGGFREGGELRLVGLGGAALIFALLLPRGIWGEIERRTGLRLLPVGYRLEIPNPSSRE